MSKVLYALVMSFFGFCSQTSGQPFDTLRPIVNCLKIDTIDSLRVSYNARITRDTIVDLRYGDVSEKWRVYMPDGIPDDAILKVDATGCFLVVDYGVGQFYLVSEHGYSKFLGYSPMFVGPSIVYSTFETSEDWDNVYIFSIEDRRIVSNFGYSRGDLVGSVYEKYVVLNLLRDGSWSTCSFNVEASDMSCTEAMEWESFEFDEKHQTLSFYDGAKRALGTLDLR